MLEPRPMAGCKKMRFAASGPAQGRQGLSRAGRAWLNAYLLVDTSLKLAQKC